MTGAQDERTEGGPGAAYRPQGRTWRRPGAKGRERTPARPTPHPSPRPIPEPAERPSTSAPKPARRRRSREQHTTPPAAVPGTKAYGRRTWLGLGGAGLVIGALALVKSQILDAPLEATVIRNPGPAPSGSTWSPAPAATRAAVDAAFGTFAPVRYAGSGEERLRVPTGITAALVLAPDTTLSWRARDAEGDSAGAGYGFYDNGATDVAVASPGQQIEEIEIRASEAWTVELWPLSTLPTLPSSGGGTGPEQVSHYLYTGPGGPVDIGYDGERYISIVEHTPEDTQRLLSVQGTVRAPRRLSPGPSIISVTVSEGTWSITAP